MAQQQSAQRPSDTPRTILAGARIARPSGVVERGRITVEGGLIGDVHSRDLDLAEGVSGSVVDLSGHLIVPGFVDMHVHGGGGGSFSSADPEECMTVVDTHRRHGTTSMVASTVTGELPDLARQAAALAELVQQGELAGIHFEGPFISRHRCGAHQPELLRDPDPADVRKLLDAAHGTASMMTLAPNCPAGRTPYGCSPTRA